MIPDISNIEDLLFVSRLFIPGESRDIVVSCVYAYIFGGQDKLWIIDIADIENPRFVSEIPIDGEDA